jgi:GNAT superfamily N-acetyltransferase
VLKARPATSDELDGVAALWIRSFKHSRSDQAGPIANHLFYEAYRPTVNYLMGRSRVVVAYEDSVPDVFLGFAVAEGGFTHHGRPVQAVHYVYVKPRYRKNGVASLALLAAGVTRHEPFLYTFRVPLLDDYVKWHPDFPGVYRRGVACGKKESTHEHRNEAQAS